MKKTNTSIETEEQEEQVAALMLLNGLMSEQEFNALTEKLLRDCTTAERPILTDMVARLREQRNINGWAAMS